MKNWRRFFLGTVSSVLVALPALPASAETGQQPSGQQDQRSMAGDRDPGQSSTMNRDQKGQQKGKSATGQPSAGGPEGEDKAGGSGPSGPQGLPPGGAPQFEGGKKVK